MASLFTGATQRFIATSTFSGGGTQQLASVRWNSSDTDLVQISTDATHHGVSLAIFAGTATITACTGSVCGTAAPTVQQALYCSAA